MMKRVSQCVNSFRSDILSTTLMRLESGVFEPNLAQIIPGFRSSGILPIRLLSPDSNISLQPLITPSSQISTQTAGLLKTIREINIQLEPMFLDHKICQGSPTLLKKCSTILMAFESLPSADEALETVDPDDYIYDPCRIAGLIYFRTLVSSLRFSDIAHQKVILELRAAVENTDVHGSWGDIPEALLWVCLVGAAAAKDVAERGWFIMRLGPVMSALGTLHFKEVANSMNLFAHIVRKTESRSLWMK
jgi:hypothetical protein